MNETKAEFFKRKAASLVEEAEHQHQNARDMERCSLILEEVIKEHALDARTLGLLKEAIEEKQRSSTKFSTYDCDDE